MPKTERELLDADLRTGRYHGALQKLDAMLARDGSVRERCFALNKRGVVLARMGDRAGAGAAFDAVLAIDPNDAPALTNLGNLENEAGSYEAALARYDAAIVADADYANAHFNKSIALKALGRIGEAVRARRTAMRLEGRARRKQRGGP